MIHQTLKMDAEHVAGVDKTRYAFVYFAKNYGPKVLL